MLSGYYKVYYTPTSGSPVFSDSVSVTVNTVPNSIVTTSDTVCQGTAAFLTAEAQSGITYTWYTSITGGISVGTGTSLTTPAIQQTTSYFIELSNTFGCIRANRFEVMAFQLPQPTADFISSASNQLADGFEIVFSNSSISATTYYWDFGDVTSTANNSIEQHPIHLYLQTGNYLTTLVATNQQGCTDTIRKIVSVLMDNNLFIPSGFTPNNDGNNDYFRVRGNNIKQSDISIYNQWGQRIWSSLSETGWDGTSNGQIVNNGSYAYAIEVTYDNGIKQFFRGNINVIR